MILAIDIGNTNISLGLFKGKKLLRATTITTSYAFKASTFIRTLKNKLPSYKKANTILICSVVPGADKAIKGMFQKLSNVKVFIVGKNLKVPIKNLYKRPKQVGQDRLVNAYAGVKLHKAPLIIIDFGTAVTFDVVSKKGAYLGGVIVPGMKLALKTLSEKAALLPNIKIKKIPFIVGKTTVQSMTGGIVYGYAAMCEGLVKKLKKKYNINFKVVATGGNSKLISRYTASIKKLDTNLTLKGINLAYLNSPKSRQK